jgi:cell division protein FtsB
MGKRKKETKKGRMSWLGMTVTTIFVAWAAITLISNQGKINMLKAENAVTEAERSEWSIRIATLQEAEQAARNLRNTARETIESDELREIYARIARDRLGLVMPGEIIIVNRTPKGHF